MRGIHHILFIHPLMGIWVVSTFWLLWIMMPWTLVCKYLAPCFQFFWVYYPEVELLCLIFLELSYSFLYWLHHFIFSPVMYKGPNFSIFSPTLIIFCLFVCLIIAILMSSDMLTDFRERGREWEREKERQRSIYQLSLVHSPAGDRTCNLGLCPNQESNLWSFDLREDTPTNQATGVRIYF